MTLMLDAALAYAARGWPVFPCSPENKAPLLPKESEPGAKDGGLYLASTDAAQIRKWWQRWPKAMIGLPTGGPSGTCVIDLDPKAFEAAAMLDAFSGWLGERPRCAMSRTRSGGLHLVFARPDERLGNRTGLFKTIPDAPEAIRAHVDVRCDGGYIIVPPSVMAEGTFYSWEVEPGRDLDPMPQKLIDAVARRLDDRSGAATATSPQAGRLPPEDALARRRESYAMAALQNGVRELSSMAKGGRNDARNRIAYSLGHLVGAGLLLESVAVAALIEACAANGLLKEEGRRATEDGIRRAITEGAMKPTDISKIGTALLRAGERPPPPSPEDYGEAAPVVPPAPTSGDDADDDGEAPPAAPPPQDDDFDWDLLRRCAAEEANDLGNGRRLRHRFGHELIHVQNVEFFAWDGRRWAEDVDGRVSRPICHKVVDAIHHEPWVIKGTDDEVAAITAAEEAMTPLKVAKDALPGAAEADKPALRAEIERLSGLVADGRKAKSAISKRRTARRKFAVSSGNSGRLTGMLAEVLSYISRKVDDLDAEALALNLGNGTLRFVATEVDDPDCPDPDITRMKIEWSVRLDSHNRLDMFSKLADAEWRPASPCPTFVAFLERILPSARVRGFMQRYLGYCLTGLTREQVFVILWGGGRNGKSTLVDIVCRILDDYSSSLPIATLVNDNRAGKGSEATPDLARLPGARLVRTAEPREGLGLDESMIKGLTSNEPIPVRRLNKEFIDVYPDFKIILSCNTKPKITGNDDGIWRRVTLVPFEVQIPVEEVDKDLSAKLWAERDGILAWLVEGCLDYLRSGLAPPEEVMLATQEYREESDVIGAFVRGALIVTGNPGDEAGSGELYAAYLRFCEKTTTPKVGATTFARRLPKAAQQFGFVKGKASTSVYQGIVVRDEFRPRDGAGRHHGDGE